MDGTTIYVACICGSFVDVLIIELLLSAAELLTFKVISLIIVDTLVGVQLSDNEEAFLHAVGSLVDLLLVCGFAIHSFIKIINSKTKFISKR